MNSTLIPSTSLEKASSSWRSGYGTGWQRTVKEEESGDDLRNCTSFPTIFALHYSPTMFTNTTPGAGYAEVDPVI